MNVEIVQDLMTQLVILVPLATGLTEVAKRAISVPERFLPLTSVIVGGVAGGLLIGFSIPAVVVGIIAGLSGTGLWEFGKTTVAGK